MATTKILPIFKLKIYISGLEHTAKILAMHGGLLRLFLCSFFFFFIYKKMQLHPLLVYIARFFSLSGVQFNVVLNVEILITSQSVIFMLSY